MARLESGRKIIKTQERQLAKTKGRETIDLALPNGIPNGEDLILNLDYAGFRITGEETKEEYLYINVGLEEFKISLHGDSESYQREGRGEDHKYPPIFCRTTLPYKMNQGLPDMGSGSWNP